MLSTNMANTITIPVFDKSAKKIEDREYSFFDVTVTDDFVTQVVRVYETNQHQGTKQAKTRGEVIGSGKKPWAQKGTGRARHGSRNSPIFRGGGVTFGPRPYTRRLVLTQKMKKLAMRYFVDSEIRLGNFAILDQKSKDMKTKDALVLVDKIAVKNNRVIVVVPNGETEICTSFRNLENVTIRRAELLSPLDFRGNVFAIVTSGAFDILLKRLGND